MFEPTELLKEYMREQPRNMRHIIGALIGYLNADPHFETDDLKSAISYVLNNGVKKEELFSELDTSVELSSDEDSWDDDYYYLAIVRLQSNFCKERLAHVRAVASKLYPKKAAPAKKSEPKAQETVTKEQKKEKGRPEPAQSKGRTAPGCATMILSLAVCAAAAALIVCIAI